MLCAQKRDGPRGWAFCLTVKNYFKEQGGLRGCHILSSIRDSDIADDAPQDPTVDAEEGEGGDPEPGQEGAPAEKLQLVALPQPETLEQQPAGESRGPERLVPPEGGPGE